MSYRFPEYLFEVYVLHPAPVYPLGRFGHLEDTGEWRRLSLHWISLTNILLTEVVYVPQASCFVCILDCPKATMTYGFLVLELLPVTLVHSVIYVSEKMDGHSFYKGNAH